MASEQTATESRKLDEMGKVKVAVVNFSAEWGSKEANVRKIKQATTDASSQGAKVIVFPECSLTGYEVEPEKKMHRKLAETVPGPSTEEVAKLARTLGVYVAFGMPELDAADGVVYNSAALVGPGGVLGSYRKVHPWVPELQWCKRGGEYPVFKTEFGLVGVGICYDNYFFPEVARVYALKGVQLLLNPTAMPDYAGWDLYELMVNQLKARASENLFYVASANLVGRELAMSFVGGSLITGPNHPATTCIYAGPASREKEEVLTATLDFSKLHRIRKSVPVFEDRCPESYRLINEQS